MGWKTFLVEKNLAWFLLKYHIEFEKYPQNIYNLKIKTEPRGWNKLFAFRDFEICDGDDILGRATTCWGLIDLNTKNMVNVGAVLADNPNFNKFEKRESDLSFNKILPMQNVDNEKVFSVRFDDLDVNQHVNNSNYIVWAFESLDYEFRKNKQLKTLDMLFKKEVSYGNNVQSQLQVLNGTTLHTLRKQDTGEELCLVQAQWG